MKLIFICVIFCFVGAMSAVAYGSVHVFQGVKFAAESVEKSSRHALNFAFTDARQELFMADAGMEKALYGMKWFGFLKPLPFFGDQITGVNQLFIAGREGIGVLEDASVIAEDFERELARDNELSDLIGGADSSGGFSAFPADLRIRLIYRLRQSSQEIDSIRLRLKLIAQALQKTEELSLIAPLEAIRVKVMQPLQDVQDMLALLAPIAKVAPQLLGANESKQWLILYANNNEIRPGGGFLGVYGLVLVKAGAIESMLVEDTYALDRISETALNRPSAPEAITRYTGVQNWYLRDANWSPDFSDSARIAAQLLREESAIAGRPVPHLDHVIGFTPEFISEVLRITGDITLHGITYTPENIAALLQEEVELGYEDRGDSFQERKRLIAEITEVLTQKILSLPVTKWPEFAKMIVAEFKEKQLFVASFDEEVQGVFTASQFAGKYYSTNTDDVLLAVDANMVANKTDLAINRTISYNIEKTLNGYRATTAIRYTHESEKTPLISDYRTFTRVFVPKGSTLVEVKGNTDSFIETIQDDLGFTTFGAFIRVPVESEGELQFVYDLPASVGLAIEKGVYQLSVFRQLGSQEIPLLLDLDFGAPIRSAIPAEERRFYGDQAYQFETTLIHDTVFTVQF